MNPMNRESANSTPKTCTPETVKELAESGLGRNQIAAQLQVTTYRVDKAAQAAGVTFDRAKVAQAVQARSVDAQAEREALASQFRQVARVTLTKVLDAEPGDLDAAQVRDLLWSAGSAAASDARYGKLALDVLQARNAQQTTDARNDVVEAIQVSMAQIMSMGEDELEALLD